MRRIDLHCYPGTPEWVAAQGPFAEALELTIVMAGVFHRNAERVLGL